MILDLLSALMRGADKQRLTQFKPPSLVDVTATKNLLINFEHYQSYCALVDWEKVSRLHPLYLQVQSLSLQMLCLADKHNPFPLLGLVHISNHVWQSADADPHVSFSLRAELGELKAHAKGWVVDVIVNGDQQGKFVYRAVGKYLIRINAPHVARKKRKDQEQRQPFWENYQQVAQWRIPDNIGRKYAKVSHDYNPIHLSAISAKLFGFKKAIAHGMWSLAKCYSQLATDKQFSGDIQLACEFLKPILLPAEVVVLKDSEGEGDQFTLLNGDLSQPHIRGSF
ncbi:MaoC/PaaZ C-terminal domain-containing protein [Alteromonas sp. ASW11-130]|uniref:MaoC/PaaZ C-terminal domain-containing protein n=1 Tax=Alteromonas sp. ASW11-130 TaxID=3015775 RepID=UPI002241FD95|nr:MaoC/PaaZ C-terminal domain-containing protein [Alteromonas sp. ASW11-130]MCW8092907.1 MaoC/PaaZ C-terminal domain-containing protein [Alteromonas sp. ASW11-130]